MKRFLVSVNHDDALPYVAFSKKVADEVGQILSSTFNNPPQIYETDEGYEEIGFVFKGVVLLSWAKETISYTNDDGDEMKVCFYAQDVNVLMGKMKQALDSTNSNVILLNLFAYPMSYALERKHVIHLRNEMRKNLDAYAVNSSKNNAMSTSWDNEMGLAGKLITRQGSDYVVVKPFDPSELKKEAIN